MAERKPYRLPTTVTPERYELKLAPDLTNWTFTGEEKIAIDVREPVREIVLNAAELDFHAISLRCPDGKVLQGSARLDPENEQATLVFKEIVPPGRSELQLRFSGVLNDKLHGFYRSTYKNPDGQEKRLASTQFESTDARRAFPCWDEPAFKAVFQVTLLVDEGLTAISNARTMRETVRPETGKKEFVFADSMKMSTYLVAFIVGEFESSDSVMAGDAPLRVWAKVQQPLEKAIAQPKGTARDQQGDAAAMALKPQSAEAVQFRRQDFDIDIGARENPNPRLSPFERTGQSHPFTAIEEPAQLIKHRRVIGDGPKPFLFGRYDNFIMDRNRSDAVEQEHAPLECPVEPLAKPLAEEQPARSDQQQGEQGTDAKDKAGEILANLQREEQDRRHGHGVTEGANGGGHATARVLQSFDRPGATVQSDRDVDREQDSERIDAIARQHVTEAQLVGDQEGQAHAHRIGCKQESIKAKPQLMELALPGAANLSCHRCS